MKATFKVLLLLAPLLLAPLLLVRANAGDAAKGKVLYDVYCSQCHGMKGTGGGINVANMTVQPRDHTDKSEMSARTDAELAKAIKHGGKAVNKSVLMPAWDKNLSDDQVDQLVTYLRQLCCEK